MRSSHGKVCATAFVSVVFLQASGAWCAFNKKFLFVSAPDAIFPCAPVRLMCVRRECCLECCYATRPQVEAIIGVSVPGLGEDENSGDEASSPVPLRETASKGAFAAFPGGPTSPANTIKGQVRFPVPYGGAMRVR